MAHEAAVVLGTLGGALLGHRLTLWQFREQEQRAFVGRQISDFYSALTGLLQQAQALIDLRTAAARAGEEGWRTLVAQAGPQADASEQFAPYAAIIEYNNRQLREEILPLSVEMIGLFTRGYGLAEESTRPHLGILVKCHAMWQRQLSESPLPPGARRAMPV